MAGKLFLGTEEQNVSVYRASTIDRNGGGVVCLDSKDGKSFVGLALTAEEATAIAQKLLEIVNEAKKGGRRE